MHSVPVEDLEDAGASRGTGGQLSQVLMASSKSSPATPSDLPSYSGPAGVPPSSTGPGVGALLSGGAVVLIDEAPKHIDPLDWTRAEWNLVGRHGDLETD